LREHTEEELSHYSKRTVDLEYETPFGWKELFGLAYRTDVDLKNHAEASGQDLRVADSETGEKFYPHVVEPTFGLTRLTLMVLLDAYHEEEVKGEKRVVLKLRPQLAPYQVVVLPLSRKDELMKVAQPLADRLCQRWSCDYDVTQSIGRRYRRQDEIGTPLCVTVDFDSLTDNAVTIRDRDTMLQDRVKIDQLENYVDEKLSNK
jgi:glycyl-tRNA synthetase